ncbi:MAG: S8 family serine peptidase [Gammaproteobacteria bacterium]|nr:S8 family serine peptidase [Gammaproteobacteria bacterium]
MADEKPAAKPVPIVSVPKDTVKLMLEKRLEQRFVPGEIVVKMEDAGDTARIMSANALSQLHLTTKQAKTSGGEIIYKIQPPNLSAMSVTDYKQRTLDTIAALKQKPGVKYAQPNYIYQISATPNDPGYPLQWHYFNNGSDPGEAPGGINLPKVWEANQGNDSVVVAIIDTGILKTHPDISGSANLISGYDMITDSFTGNDGDGRDNDATDSGDAIAADECYPGSPALPSSWHGSHVAGTVGVGKTDNNSGVAGVNWHVKVLPVRALGKCGGTMVDINDAIRWAAGIAVNGVPQNTNPAKVINLSLGGAIPCSSSPATQAAINDAVGQGATVVVAAGNDAQDAAGFVPAGCDNVVSVAAADRNGNLVTRYSNYGTKVDILAPGGDVSADTDNDGNPDGVLSMVQGGYAFYNGTSMAAPHVAGVAALLLASNPGLTPAQVESRLKSAAIPRNATQCPKPCGAGLLNAQVAINQGYTLSLSKSNIALKEEESTTLTATLLKQGVPEKDQTINFTIADSAKASVQPTSVKTDEQGQVQATIAAKQAGDTQLTVGYNNQISAMATVKVEEKKGGALSWWYLALLFGFAMAAQLRKYSNRRVGVIPT